ncbi:hypothetical protein ZIOFF_003243 [Zingiber officinale]|uniref:Gag-pol polyprotein n=1 Tax=Zingiber officinale TaxID=94328 RepID=A0A8J5HY29_ZINOF|nr:hypothetical protein ZIOFF_003243 [Zingiber officinale]
MSMGNPIMSLLANNTLTGENFPKWKSNINIMLVSENNRFVLTEECPPVPPANAARAVRELYDRWIASNNKAKAYMLASMSDALRSKMEPKECAFEIMESLQEMFGNNLSKLIMRPQERLVKNKAKANIVNKPNSSKGLKRKMAKGGKSGGKFKKTKDESKNNKTICKKLLSSLRELADGELTLRVGNGALVSVKAVGVTQLERKIVALEELRQPVKNSDDLRILGANSRSEILTRKLPKAHYLSVIGVTVAYKMKSLSQGVSRLGGRRRRRDGSICRGRSPQHRDLPLDEGVVLPERSSEEWFAERGLPERSWMEKAA